MQSSKRGHFQNYHNANMQTAQIVVYIPLLQANMVACMCPGDIFNRGSARLRRICKKNHNNNKTHFVALCICCLLNVAADCV